MRRTPVRVERATGLPAFRAPQLATLVDRVPSGNDWLHEVKYDGYRCLLAIGRSSARVYTRSGLDWSEHFPALVKAAPSLPTRSALLDGEAVVLDAQGRSHFQQLQASLKSGRADVVYFAFDLLEEDGEDLTRKNLLDRKTRLAKLMGRRKGPIRFSDHVRGLGEKMLETFCDAGLEGVVSKRADAPYVGARTRTWLKIKCVHRQEFVIVGWTSSDKDRAFRSLVVATHDQGLLRYAGKVGTGFGVEERSRLLALLTPLAQEKPTVDAPKPDARGVHWVRPALVAEIAFTEMTSDGVLRHPSYVGMRTDKKPEAVVLEVAKKTRDATQARPPALVTISHRDRVLFPESNITKGQLADYYEQIAEVMLPWVVERPISLIRCPRGREKKCFFQKHDAGTFGENVRHVAIREKDGSVEPYLFIENVEGLLTCVQMGTIEFHGWGCRVEDVEKPDRLVFDLDPDTGVGFGDIMKAALEFRELLAEIGLVTFPMVTGGKGLHVIAPLTPKAEWPSIRDVARRFATAVAQRDPKRFTANLSKAARGGRIFIDYLRNARGATAVLPYSVRARTHAPVAAPIAWDELKGLRSADGFRLPDVAELIKRAASPLLEGWGRADQSLPDL